MAESHWHSYSTFRREAWCLCWVVNQLPISAVYKIWLQNYRFISFARWRCTLNVGRDLISRQKSKLLELRLNNKKLKNENRKLHQKLHEYENLPSKLKIIVTQAMQNTEAKSKTGHRYSVDWLLDALLIRCKSTKAYRMLRDNGYLPLPSINTLNNSINQCAQSLDSTRRYLPDLQKNWPASHVMNVEECWCLTKFRLVRMLISDLKLEGWLAWLITENTPPQKMNSKKVIMHWFSCFNHTSVDGFKASVPFVQLEQLQQQSSSNSFFRQLFYWRILEHKLMV